MKIFFHVFILLVGVVFAQQGKIRIGVIGSGISGASFTYFLREISSTGDIEIDVYESGSRTSGRIMNYDFAINKTEHIEAGASILHGSNYYMKSFAAMLNLTTVKPERNNSLLGIYNGNVLYKTSNSHFWTICSMIFRYGLFNVFRLRNSISEVANRFSLFYSLQNTSKITDAVNSTYLPTGYRRVEDLLTAVGLYDLTQMSITKFLVDDAKLSDGSHLMKELLSAAVRVNYNQPMSVNALAGSVGIIPVIQLDLFMISEGNERIPKHLIEKFSSHLMLNHTVTSIEYVSSSTGETFRITGRKKQTNRKCFNSTDPQEGTCILDDALDGELNEANPNEIIFQQEYDFVVIATPLEVANINFINMNLSQGMIKSSDATFNEKSTPGKYIENDDMPQGIIFREFQHTHATFVRGIINKTALGIEHDFEFPATFLTVPNDESSEPDVFTSIGCYDFDPSTNQSLYKIFSKEALSETSLRRLFSHRSKVESIDWQAYPKFASSERFSSFEIFPRVYYINAFENAVSCMEAMCVAAKNVAILLAQNLQSFSR